MCHQEEEVTGEGPSPGWYNKTPQPGSLKNRRLFLPVLEAETSKLRCQQIEFLVSALILACRQPPSGRILTS